MRKIGIVVTLLITILLILGACAPAPPTEPTPTPTPVYKEVELKYDDGHSEGCCSQASGWGYSVHFSPPATPFTISQVKVMAGVYGTEYADRKATVEIWSQDFEVLYSHEIPATELSHEKDWVTVETNITVDGDFRVVFFANSGGEEGGISICYDLSGTNKGSEVVKAGGIIADWPSAWEMSRPRRITNWMIRVISTAMPPAD